MWWLPVSWLQQEEGKSIGIEVPTWRQHAASLDVADLLTAMSSSFCAGGAAAGAGDEPFRVLVGKTWERLLGCALAVLNRQVGNNQITP